LGWVVKKFLEIVCFFLKTIIEKRKRINDNLMKKDRKLGGLGWMGARPVFSWFIL